MTLHQETEITLKSGETLRAIFTEADHACVRTEASNGERRSINVNGVPVTVILHFYRQDDGSWIAGDFSRYSVSRADQFLGQVSDAGRRKVRDVICPEIGQLLANLVAETSIAREAELVDAGREVVAAQRDVERAREMLAAAERVLEEKKARLDAAVKAAQTS